MSIDTGLGTKLTKGASTSAKDLVYADDIEENTYRATLSIVYPWKKITKDTTIRAKDEQGKYVKDDGGSYVRVPVKDVTWYYTDIVFTIDDGDYAGLSVKGSLSTHPDMIGSAKRFLYNAELFDVALEDLKDHVGSKVGIYVKTKVDSYVDRTTGAPVTKAKPYVSYYSKYNGEEDTEDLGI